MIVPTPAMNDKILQTEKDSKTSTIAHTVPMCETMLETYAPQVPMFEDSIDNEINDLKQKASRIW